MISNGYCEWMRRLAASGKSRWALRHARTCPSCRATLEIQAAMDARLRGAPNLLPAAPVSDDLWSRIESRIADIDSPKRAGHRAAWVATGVAACSLIAGFWFGGLDRIHEQSGAMAPNSSSFVSNGDSAKSSSLAKMKRRSSSPSAPKSAIASAVKSPVAGVKISASNRRIVAIRTPRSPRKITPQENRTSEPPALAPSVPSIRSDSVNSGRREIADLPKSSDYLSESHALDSSIPQRFAENGAYAYDEKKRKTEDRAASNKMSVDALKPSAFGGMSEAETKAAPAKTMRTLTVASPMKKDAVAPAGSANRQFLASVKPLGPDEAPALSESASVTDAKSAAPLMRPSSGSARLSADANLSKRKPSEMSAGARGGGAGGSFGYLRESINNGAPSHSEDALTLSVTAKSKEASSLHYQSKDDEEKREGDVSAHAKKRLDDASDKAVMKAVSAPDQAKILTKDAPGAKKPALELHAIQLKERAQIASPRKTGSSNARSESKRRREAKNEALRICRRGLTYLREGDAREARESFQRALKIDPGCEPARRALKAMTFR